MAKSTKSTNDNTEQNQAWNELLIARKDEQDAQGQILAPDADGNTADLRFNIGASIRPLFADEVLGDTAKPRWHPSTKMDPNNSQEIPL